MSAVRVQSTFQTQGRVDRPSKSPGLWRDPFSVSRGLPEPVRALAHRLGATESRERSHVTLSQRGHFCGRHESRTVSYTALQVIDLLDVGFAWRAKYGSWGLISASARLGGGVAQRSLAAFKVLPIFITRGGADLLWVERVRYLSDLVWAPDAILCNPYVRWLPIDGNTLLASTGDTPDSAHVMVHLDAFGRIQDVEAESDSIASSAGEISTVRRMRSVSRVSFSDYADIGGRCVPKRASSICYLEGERIAGWECELTKWSFI